MHVGARWNARGCARTLQFGLDGSEAIHRLDERLRIVTLRRRDLIGIQRHDRVDGCQDAVAPTFDTRARILNGGLPSGRLEFIATSL